MLYKSRTFGEDTYRILTFLVRVFVSSTRRILILFLKLDYNSVNTISFVIQFKIEMREDIYQRLNLDKRCVQSCLYWSADFFFFSTSIHHSYD